MGWGNTRSRTRKKHPRRMNTGRGQYGKVHLLTLSVRDGAVRIAALSISKGDYSKLLLQG